MYQNLISKNYTEWLKVSSLYHEETSDTEHITILTQRKFIQNGTLQIF